MVKSMVNWENLVERLHEIISPVLIVQGEMDAGWPLEHAVDIRKGLINAKVFFGIIKGSCHLVLRIRGSWNVSGVIGDFVDNEVLNTCQNFLSLFPLLSQR